MTSIPLCRPVPRLERPRPYLDGRSTPAAPDGLIALTGFALGEGIDLARLRARSVAEVIDGSVDRVVL
ncbi:MAG: hypothetical protein AAGA54_24070 [Myxococcota bacterium]